LDMNSYIHLPVEIILSGLEDIIFKEFWQYIQFLRGYFTNY
jgi:hypothetical protein